MGEWVTVCEVGPRDGLQIAKSIMPTAAKANWIAAMAAAGVREIEVGSFVPPKLIPQMADTAEIVRAAVALPGLTVVALAPNLKGAQNAYAAGVHRIIVPVSVSEGHSRANTNRGTFEQVAEVGRVVAWLRDQERRVTLEAACATAFGCSIDGVIPTDAVVKVAEGLAQAGADRVALADTVGYGNPAQVHEVVRAVRAAIGPKLAKLHLHDTMGPRPGQRAGRAGGGHPRLRCRPRRAGGLPVRARRLRQHRHRGSGLHAGKHGFFHRHRAGKADRRARPAARRRAG
jgi:hydroxymethylglutaryl-CoA lyase